MVRVQLPYHLQNLAGVGPEVELPVPDPPTQRGLIAALEQRYPTLRSAIIDVHNGKRRPLIRFFACQEDVSHWPLDSALPAPVIEGQEVFMIVGAISGG